MLSRLMALIFPAPAEPPPRPDPERAARAAVAARMPCDRETCRLPQCAARRRAEAVGHPATTSKEPLL